MDKLKVKIITGFREDQHYTIPAYEAYKAYYLFLNPQKRGIFSNGVAIVGQNIQGIEPDYISSMGWNPSHKLSPDDWNEIRASGIDKQLRDALSKAKEIASTGDIQSLESVKNNILSIK